LLRDENGLIPLHHACLLENITVALILMNGIGGKKALMTMSNNNEMPITLCKSEFMKVSSLMMMMMMMMMMMILR